MNTKSLPVDATWQTIKACLIAPWTIIPVILLYSLFSGAGQISTALQFTFLFSLFGVPIAYLITAFVGLPTHLLLRKIGVRKPYVYSAFGALFVFVFFVMNDLNARAFILNLYRGELWFFVTCGVAVATTFGMIAEKHIE